MKHCKRKDLKKNTYKMLVVHYYNNGFVIIEFEANQEYEEVILYCNNEMIENPKYDIKIMKEEELSKIPKYINLFKKIEYYQNINMDEKSTYLSNEEYEWYKNENLKRLNKENSKLIKSK